MSRRRRSKARPQRRVPLRVAAIAAAGLALMLLAMLAVSRMGASANAFERAQQFAEAGDLGAARVEAMNAVEQEPGNEAAWRLLARTQLSLGDGQSATGTVERARAAGVPAGRTRHLMAEALLLNGDEAAALAETETGDIDPEFHAATARVRGRAFAQAGEIGAAADAFNFAIETAPEDPALWIDIARFRIDTGELSGAIEAADRAIELAPENAEALVLKGVLARTQYGLVESLGWFDRALAVDDDYLPAMIERAKTLGEAGRYTEMLAATREILGRDAGNPQALYLQAVLAARARNFTLAQRLVELTNERLDGMPAMQLLQASIDYRQQNYESAIRRLETLIEEQPGNRTAQRLLGAAFFRSGDMDAAIDTLAPLARRADADSYVLTLIGRALEGRGDRTAALPYLQRAAMAARGAVAPVGTGPDGVNLGALEQAAAEGGAGEQIALIRGYLVTGRIGDALGRAEALRNANPQAPDAHIVLGDTLAAAGDFTAAAAAYADAANIRFDEPTALRMVEALMRAGQPQGALDALSLYRQQNPRSIAAARFAGDINLSLGRWRAAIAQYQLVRAMIGDRDASVLAGLALAWHESGNEGRAAALARRAYLLVPMNPAVSEVYGWTLFDGDIDQARGIEMMEKARDMMPNNSATQWRLARAYAATGRRAAAGRAARIALADPNFRQREEARALAGSL